VVLFTHRHSPDFLRSMLPSGMRLAHLTPMSKSWARTFKTEFCYMGVVERISPLARTATRSIPGGSYCEVVRRGGLTSNSGE
jgi:hypothetical protein